MYDKLWNINSIVLLTYKSKGNFGKPFKLVKPTLIKLRLRKLVYSSVRPTIAVLRQSSKINDSI